MNQRANYRRIFRNSAVCLLAASMCGSGLAWGQAAPAVPPAAGATAAPPPPVFFPAAMIPAKSAAALSAAQIAGVTNYVNTAVQTLATSNNAEQVRQTRNNLENAAILGPGQAATADYERVFTSALSAAVVKAMQNRDVRARTSVGAAVYRVVMRTRHPGLVPGIKALLQDKSEAVANWGTRIARVMYPGLLTAAPADAAALAPLMIGAMRTHYRSPAIAEDVFEGLSGEPTQAVIMGLGAAARGPIDSIISLLQARAQLFSNAVAQIPPEEEASKFPAVIQPPPRPPIVPQMEVGAADFLVLPTRGGRLTTPQQKAALGRALYDLSTEMIRLAPQLPPAGGPTDTQIRQNDLLYILGRTASALQVLTNGTPAAPIAKQIQQGANSRDLNQPALEGFMQQLEPAMTAANLLAPKPAAPAAPVAPAPARPAPAAQRPPAGGTPTLNK